MQRKMSVTDWLRLILGLAALGLATLTLVNLANGSTPAYSELTELSGAYLRLDRRADDSNLYLYIQNSSGITEEFILNSILNLDTAELSRRLTPGETVTVRYQNDEYRNVYELTGEDGPILTYAQAAAADRENQNWGYGLLAACLVSALGLLAVWALWDRRKRRREAQDRADRRRREAEEQARVAAQKPVVYAPEERETVEHYIRDAFGPIAQIFHEPPMHDIQLDIAVAAPTERENFYKLVTVGMGARRMDVPPELAESNRSYAELAIFLPPEWNLLGDNETDTWPFTWLKKIARMPITDCDWVGQGFLFSTDRPLDTDGNFTALLLAAASVREGSGDRLLMPGGHIVNFYQLYPIRSEEEAYVRARGVWHLWQRLMGAGVTPVVDLCRDSCCDPDAWLSEDIAPFCWTEGKEEYYLGMDADAFPEDLFTDAGLSGSGLDWERLARAFLEKHQPHDLPFLSFACDETTFFVSCRDAELLSGFALSFRDFCGERERVTELLKQSLAADGPSKSDE